jgi:SHS2 domain-containing protein
VYEATETDSGAELLVEDVNGEALFSETLLGLGGVLSHAVGGTQVTHEVQVSGDDLEALLTSWVEELVRLAESDGFVPERAFEERLGRTSFRARIAGERGIPPERIRPLAVREVRVERLEDGAWAARIVLAEEGSAPAPQ